ncbi:MAG: N-acetyltransferase family protein [Marinifilaceae bacterium]
MKSKPTIHTTKSGNEILVREAVTSDAVSLIACIKSYLKSNLIPLTGNEFNPSIEEQSKWIENFLTNRNDLLLVAEYKGQVIGNIDLTAGKRRMLKHTGHLGMGIHEDWQNQGVGTILVEKLMEWIDNYSELELLWLQVFGTNQKGIRLYKKFGFAEEGRQPGFIKNSDGKYIDNVIMTRRKQ